MAWILIVIGAHLLQGYIPEWFVSETGQITIDSFGPFTPLAVIGLLLGWRWVWHGTILWFLQDTGGYLMRLKYLLAPAPNCINEYAFG